jgi:hypothetical protein
VGRGLGVTLGVAVGVGVGVGVPVGLGVTVGVGVGVGPPCGQYLPPVSKKSYLKPSKNTPPQTIIWLPIQIAV